MKLLKQSTGTGDGSGQFLYAASNQDETDVNLVDYNDSSFNLSDTKKPFLLPYAKPGKPKHFHSQADSCGENEISGEKSGSDLRDQTVSSDLPPEFRSAEKLPTFEKAGDTGACGASAVTPATEVQHLTAPPVGGSNYIHDAMNRMINHQNSADWRQDSQESEVRKALLEKRRRADLPGNKYTSSEASYDVTTSVD